MLSSIVCQELTSSLAWSAPLSMPVGDFGWYCHVLSLDPSTLRCFQILPSRFMLSHGTLQIQSFWCLLLYIWPHCMSKSHEKIIKLIVWIVKRSEPVVGQERYLKRVIVLYSAANGSPDTSAIIISSCYLLFMSDVQPFHETNIVF